MSVKFQCSSCKVVRAINPRLLGREIACPECGSPVQLPTEEQIEAARRRREQQQTTASLQAALEAATRRAESKSKPKKKIEHDDEKDLAASSANFTKPKPASGEDMDMTPMVDVTFLLLIFFMVTASFSVQKSVSRPPPREEDPSTNAVEKDPEEESDIVTVQIDEVNAYNIVTSDWDRTVASKQDLILALEEAHTGDSSGNQPSKVIIQAHEDCIHASVISALDAGRQAQFESFEVSTVEEFQ